MLEETPTNKYKGNCKFIKTYLTIDMLMYLLFVEYG